MCLLLRFSFGILEDGAFDEVVNGVDGIEHVASPVIVTASDPNELIVPAVRSTITLFQSVLKYGTSVKRIVFTSSCAAVFTYLPEARVFTEKDWHDVAVKECQKKGKGTSGALIYSASKVLSERSAWDIYHENKNTVSWDLVVLNPTDVYGPVINEAPTPESLNYTARLWLDTVFKGTMNDAELVKLGYVGHDIIFVICLTVNEI